MKKKNLLVKMLLLVLVCSFVIPGQAFASLPNQEIVRPQESAYLATYSAYCYGPGGGQVQVWFDVSGTNYMDDIGALVIEIYESRDSVNWTWVETFTNGSDPYMLGHNTFEYGNHVTYQGVGGRYYKAKVCVWAGKNGGGDRRYFWTLPEFIG